VRAGEEAVVLDPDRFPLGPPHLPGHGQQAHLLLLFRIDADHRLARGLVLFDLLVDVVELRVAVGMLLAFQGLGVALQAEPVLLQQPAHRGRGHLVSLPGQLGGQVP
jgi:hypothetical protein